MAHVITEGRSASAAVAKAPGKAGAEEEAMVLLPAASLALLPVALVERRRRSEERDRCSR